MPKSTPLLYCIHDKDGQIPFLNLNTRWNQYFEIEWWNEPMNQLKAVCILSFDRGRKMFYETSLSTLARVCLITLGNEGFMRGERGREGLQCTTSLLPNEWYGPPPSTPPFWHLPFLLSDSPVFFPCIIGKCNKWQIQNTQQENVVLGTLVGWGGKLERWEATAAERMNGRMEED